MDDFTVKAVARALMWLSLGFAGGLAFSLILKVWGPISLETVQECSGSSYYCIAQSWQTLFTGLIAVAIAFFTWRHMREEARINAWLKFREMMNDYTMAQSHRQQCHDNMQKIRTVRRDLEAQQDRNTMVPIGAIPLIGFLDDAKPRREFNSLYCDMYLTTLKSCADFRRTSMAMFEQNLLTVAMLDDLMKPVEREIGELLDAAMNCVAEGAGELRSWNSRVPDRFKITIKDEWAEDGLWY